MDRLAAYMDVESYPNYFLLQIMLADGRGKSFEVHEDGPPLDREAVLALLQHPLVEVYTFNGNTYDVPMLRCALRGAGPKDLHRLSDRLVQGDLRPWNVRLEFPQHQFDFNHVDLFDVAPGMGSLKLYGGRLHVPSLQDLPFPPGTVLTPEQKRTVRTYCRNDTRITMALHKSLVGEIELRRVMSEQMNEDLRSAGMYALHGPVDLRSKSDAQIAEAVLCHRVLLATGSKPNKHKIAYREFTYTPPEYIKFSSRTLNEVLEVVRSTKMEIGDSGHVVMPKEIERLNITLKGSSYKIGIGGLHSRESEVSHYADEDTIIRDVDVRSYYPNLILNMGMYPVSFGPHFLSAYRNILTERLAAKDAGNKIVDASLKIVCNGTFGKTSSPYSALYNPKMMVATTLTGQLSILMLIELLERGGISVVSANTDGIVLKFPRRLENLQRHIVSVWEKVTNLETEETDYVSIHSRDVNSYIAIKPDGKVKTKGAFALPSTMRERLMKSPQNEICVEALIEYVRNGTPLAKTIRECRDVRKFISLRKVTGGASADGEEIGKVVRWYYSTQGSSMSYTSNGNQVPKSQGAMPLMSISDEFPDDVDYAKYEAEAEEMLFSVGLKQRPVIPKLPRRNTKAWAALLEHGLVEVTPEGKPAWAVPLDRIPGDWHRLVK